MRILLLVPVFIFIASCLPPKTYFLNKSYTFEQGTVKIALFPLQRSAITIKNPGDLVKHFEATCGTPERIIMDTGYKYIAQGASDTIKKAAVLWLPAVDTNTMLDDSNSFKVEKIIGKDSTRYTFMVPKREYLNRLFKGANAVILISGIAFGQNSIPMGGSAPTMVSAGSTGAGMIMGGGSSSIRTFDAKVTYLVWDYEKNEIISCGLTMNQQGYLLFPNQKTWKSLFSVIGRGIAERTPFKVPQQNDGL